MEIEGIKSIIRDKSKVFWTEHASNQILNRGLSREAVFACIDNGEIIENYPSAYPYPACLILGYSENMPIHVCLGIDGLFVWIITAYEPSLLKFKDDFKTRREAAK